MTDGLYGRWNLRALTKITFAPFAVKTPGAPLWLIKYQFRKSRIALGTTGVHGDDTAAGVESAFDDEIEQTIKHLAGIYRIEFDVIVRLELAYECEQFSRGPGVATEMVAEFDMPVVPFRLAVISEHPADFGVEKVRSFEDGKANGLLIRCYCAGYAGQCRSGAAGHTDDIEISADIWDDFSAALYCQLVTAAFRQQIEVTKAMMQLLEKSL